MRERFDRYMDRCLYDPRNGFYAAGGGSAGRRSGDFITSPEVGPLFADVIGNALDHWWNVLDRPEPFRIFDAGTGPGTLANMLARLGGDGAQARRVAGFDREPAGSEPPGDLAGSVVIANELLDNLPVRIVERQAAGWQEVFVVSDEGSAEGPPASPSEELADLQPALSRAQVELLESLPIGSRIPLLDEARTWVQQVLDQRPAVLLVFDYGCTTTAELQRRGGWLRTYRNHARGHDPYHAPGLSDITADIAVDQLPEPHEVMTQSEFLTRWRIDELVEEGRSYWRANAAAPDIGALRMRSRVAESDALLDPDGLGAWLVCVWKSDQLLEAED